jgi:very-short-patch-repair endonuclease
MTRGIKRIAIETKDCARCGTEFQRNRKLSGAQWQNTRWCSRSCGTWNKGLTKDEDSRLQSIADHVRVASRGRPAWSKGLTKETHPSLAIVSRKVSEAQRGRQINDAQRAGLTIGRTWSKGHTKENCPIIARRAAKRAGVGAGIPNPAHSKRMLAFYAANPEKHPNAILARKTKGRGHTHIEKIVSDILTESGVAFNFNVNIGNKWPDFSIPSCRLIIEADGEYWHQDAEKEAARDAYLQSLGWRVMHFPGKALVGDTEGCRAQINAAIVEYAR